MKKRIVCIVMACVMAISVSGCGIADVLKDSSSSDKIAEQSDKVQEDNSVLTEKSDVNGFQDNEAVYEDMEDTSVVTMYLTVSQGNSSEHTDHTWKEINSHSTYYYEENGKEPYSVNGLLQIGNEKGPSRGKLGFGEKLPNAIVKVRGKSTSQAAQKSYKIELKDGKGKWNNQRVINLNKHPNDGLRFRNMMFFRMLRDMPGLTSMQTQFVHLYVKDITEKDGGKFKDYGLYTQVEQPNKSFLERHGFDKNGQLYKLSHFEFYRYEDGIKLKNSSDYDEKKFEEYLEIKGSDDHSKLIRLLDDINDYSVKTDDIIKKYFDEDNILSWLAFNILVGNIDTQSQNTLLYSPLNENKWYFMEWDGDGIFIRTEQEFRNKYNKSSWEHGVSNYWGSQLMKRILKSDNIREKLSDKVEEYKKILSKKYINKLADRYAKVVKPYVYQRPDRVYAPLTKNGYDKVKNNLADEIEKNYESYEKSLKEPMPFFIGVPEKSSSGVKFVWENSYDFEAKDITYTFELADNLDFKKPIVKETNLFIPEYEYKQKLKPGQYFMRVKAVNEYKNEQYAFDYYVAEGDRKRYGVKCVYVLPDGSIQEETYEG